MYQVDALRRALEVLTSVVEKGYDASLSEIVRDVDLPKSTVFRYLRSLADAGYIERDEVHDRYRVGPQFSSLARRSEFFNRLRGAARPEMEELFGRFRQTTNLGVLDGDRVVYLDILERRRAPEMKARIGSRDALHSTALGKALLAHLPESKRSALLDMPLPVRTFRTITSRAALERELNLAAKRGYALDEEENEDGTMCVGVPILSGPTLPIAAISISAVRKLPLEQVIPLLQRSAAIIAVALNVSPVGDPGAP